jgi:membrane associated rhomboid family serine protease
MHAPAVNYRERWRWLAADLRVARCTLATVVVIGIVHGLIIATQSLELYTHLGLTRAGIGGGKLWQLVTYAFLHGPWWHLALNAVALLLAGARVERIGGRSTFLSVFFTGVVAGGTAQLLLSPAPLKILVGASGGIFALVLWLVTVSPDSRMWLLKVSGRSLGIGLLAAEAGLLLAAWLVPASGLADIGSACHLSGGIAGWLLGRRVVGGRQLTREDLLAARARREASEDS